MAHDPTPSSPPPPSPQEDPRLARIRAGDLLAFDAFYHATVPALLRFAYSIAPEHLADEAIQDIMLGIWENRETLRVEGSLRGYVFGAVRLRIADRLRREKMTTEINATLGASLHPTIVGGNFAPSPSVQAETQELEQAIREALATLPPKSRMILMLRWMDGLKYPEIAAALGISVDAAKKQGRRMEVIIRELLSRFASE